MEIHEMGVALVASEVTRSVNMFETLRVCEWRQAMKFWESSSNISGSRKRLAIGRNFE